MRRQARALFICVALFTFFASATTAIADAPPSVTIDAPTEVKYQTAHVSGTVDPEGGPSTTYWRFEYTSEPSNPFGWAWSSVSGEISGAEATGTDPIPVAGELMGLTPGTEYAVRLVADNGEFANHVESPLPNPTFTTLTVAPPTVTLPPPSSVTARAAHFEAEIDPGGNDPAFNTSWFLSCTPACPGVEGNVPGDGAVHNIPVDVSGLMPGTEYEAILYATNAGGTESSAPQTFTTGTEAPTIEKVFAHALTTEAELIAEIEPGGLETSYHFEYGPTAAYGQSTATTTLPAGGSVAKVTARISGLAPGATYHYQLIAENADGSAESGDRSFTERSDMGGLPAGRGYELVSDEDGNLGDVIRVNSADDGSVVEYLTTAGIDTSRSAFFKSASVATRGVDGWTKASLDPSAPFLMQGQIRLGGQILALSPDLKSALIMSFASLDPEDQNISGDIYRVDSETGKTTWISRPEVPSSVDNQDLFLGASADLHRVYFMARPNFIPEVDVASIVEWNEGALSVASRLPDGTSTDIDFGAVTWPSQYSAFPHAENSGSNQSSAPHGGTHAVSLDGSTIFFKLTGAGSLAARRAGQTILISDSQRPGSEGEACSSTFVGASRSGDLAYFLCSNQLTDEATEGGGLYSYRLPTGELTLLTPPAGRAGGLEVTDGIVSDDASHVYFVSTAALTPAATEGSSNLYVYSDGATRLITALPPETHVERVSRSGRYLLLGSPGSLAGADTAGHDAIYRYDDQTQEIVCVSCRADGSPSAGDATLAERLAVALFAAPSRPRNITDTGDVFFASSDQLVPQDQTAAQDVYEYTEGEPHLLSSGRSRYDSYVEDNSDDGTDAFFLTRSSLLPRDQDGGLLDLYDARVGGGFPESETDAEECVEDACQGAMPAASREKVIGTSAVKAGVRAKRRAGHLISARPQTRGRSILLRVRVSGPGKLIVHGRSVGVERRNVAHAGSLRMLLRLKGWARRRLAAEGHLKAPLSVRFASAGRPPSERTVIARFEER